MAADTCTAVQPLTLEPSGELMLARTTAQLDCPSKDMCANKLNRYFAVTPAQRSFVFVVAVPSVADQQLMLNRVHDCPGTIRNESYAPLGGQASARYEVDSGDTLVLAVTDHKGVGGEIELLVAVEAQ